MEGKESGSALIFNLIQPRPVIQIKTSCKISNLLQPGVDIEIKKLNDRIDNISEWISLFSMALAGGVGKRLFSQDTPLNTLPVGERLLSLKREREECRLKKRDLELRLKLTRLRIANYVEQYSSLVAEEIHLFESQFPGACRIKLLKSDVQISI